MNKGLTTILLAAAVLILGAGAASATAPCGDFGECKVLIETNSTDGDIGFHFLMDGDDLLAARITDPNGTKIFEDKAKGPLAEQKLTETFAESAEPLCWNDPEADEDEEIVTLEEFLDRWTPGTYVFSGRSEGGAADQSESQGALGRRQTGFVGRSPVGTGHPGQAPQMSVGESELSFDLPAAPADLEFDGAVISWMPGDDLGNCADFDDLVALVGSGVLPTHPVDVEVVVYEVVMEPDVDDDDPRDGLKYTVRVPGDTLAVTVPADYLASLGSDTPAKIEVGAITEDDNATFTEEGDICLNEDEGCEEEEE